MAPGGRRAGAPKEAAPASELAASAKTGKLNLDNLRTYRRMYSLKRSQCSNRTECRQQLLRAPHGIFRQRCLLHARQVRL